MRKITVRIGLVEMNEAMALAYCVNLVKREWSTMPVDDVFALWGAIKSYIQSRYNDGGISVPGHLEGSWRRCKKIIDEEVGQ
ncbi:MAG: hypothetical protein J5699_00840 [Bacteroidales bacterium]|nr:hypothetical protein [Bacteroidales bacterium]